MDRKRSYLRKLLEIALFCAVMLGAGGNSSSEPEGTQSGSELRGAEESSEFPLTCITREFAFQAVQTDRNGKKCRGTVNTKACYGSCDTFEYGGPDGTLITETQVCMHDKTKEKTATLTDCEAGAEEATKQFVYFEAESCACAACDPTKANCVNRPSKRTTFSPKLKDLFRIEADDSLEGFFESKPIRVSKLKQAKKKAHQKRSYREKQRRSRKRNY